MEIIRTKKALRNLMEPMAASRMKFGLVPTMGALHAGHLSLIKEAKNHCDQLICSIFVNPTQFNDPHDLANYPKPIEQDINLLEQANCDILFLPSIEEMYTEAESWYVDLGELDRIWEGEKRPGHYQGVTQIVMKLFNLINPDKAFFGQKDFQQCLVIKRMIEQFELKVQLYICPTVRDEDGLALSSRNARLSKKERSEALAISKALFQIKYDFQKKSLNQLEYEALNRLTNAPGVEIEYIAICKAADLSRATNKEGELIAIVAAWVGRVRLIDNVLLS